MKPKILISLKEGGENGGPFVSHKRIMESSLKEKYEFIPLIIPKGRIGFFNLKLILKIVKKINKIKPDIVHFDGLQLQGFHLALACRLAGVKNSVLAIHGSSMEALDIPGWKKGILNIMEIITLRLPKVCYGVSRYVSSWQRVKKYPRWYYGHIYNMPGFQDVVREPQSIRKELGIAENDVIVVSTGRITQEKGYGILLDVMKAMKPFSNVKFIVAGDGNYLSILKKESKDNNLDKSVFLLGYRKDISRILIESDIFIICTLHETLCISIIEACFYSLPVIATKVGGIPEIVDNGINGYLVEKNDIESIVKVLKELVDNPEKRKNMGIKGKKMAENRFSTEEIIFKIDDLYQKVLTKND